MPNHITSRIVVEGDNAKELMKKYFKKENFDFNKVIRMPKKLRETKESTETPKEVFEANQKKYGFKSWYDFGIAKWGTKWNAYDQEFTNYDNFIIRTAWNAPLPVIEELSRQNPNLEITITYADENIGSNTGTITFKNGDAVKVNQPSNGSKEAYDIYYYLNPNEMQLCKWNEEKKKYERYDGE